MGNYTTLKLEVTVKLSALRYFQHLDTWLKESVIYNPEITPELHWESGADSRVCTEDGSPVTIPIYSGDTHPFFINPDARRLIGLDKVELNDEPIWQFDGQSRQLSINAYFKDRHNTLDQFLDWLSPFVESIQDSEYNYEGDLEGPRYVRLSNCDLKIDEWSFTR